MLIDSRALADAATVRADVCIVGAGAAGITLARELAAPGRRVALLESGGFEFDAPTQELYDGPTDGSSPAPEPSYLRSSRLRYFGGTTNHWEGWCRKFDAIDFEARDWVPLSGWPVTRAELDPYYDRACSHLAIPSLDGDAYGRGLAPAQHLFPEGSALFTTAFLRAAPMRFGTYYREELTRAPDIDVYLWANAIEVQSNHDGEQVTTVRAATLSGKRFEVRARIYVLATGAIEVPRLLLASNSAQSTGLGNANDMVGRCFMEHPRLEGIGGAVILRRGRALSTYAEHAVDSQQWAWPALTASAEIQRQHQLLNACFGFRPGNAPEHAASIANLARAVEKLDTTTQQRRAPVSLTELTINCEQAPNRSSRVRLADEKDPFDRPRARLEWKLSDLDALSLRRWLEFLARELGRSGIGRGGFDFDDANPWRGVLTSAHSIGTTRMSRDPKEGVVDPNLRIHGYDNVYIASTAVFPTSGLASPTATLVAFTLRLADHLRERLT